MPIDSREDCEPATASRSMRRLRGISGPIPEEGTTSETTVLTGSYDYRLVVSSIAIAILAAYAALDIAGRVTVSRNRAKAFWLAGGAIAMGLGIWAMHYVGMFAFTLPVPVFYHYPTVLLSLLAAITASAVALFTVSRERMGLSQEMVGSLIMGGGIAAIHYIGMAAMRLPATMEYRWAVVVLSVFLAIGVSLVALILAFRVRQEPGISIRKLLSALAMGSAIALMHYSGMWAVTFHASNIAFSATHSVHVSFLSFAVISVTSFLVLVLVLATASFDRRLEGQRSVTEAARDAEEHFRVLTEAIPRSCGQRGLTVRQTIAISAGTR